MALWILCQDCGVVFDTGDGTHYCDSKMTGEILTSSGFCDNCGHHAADLSLSPEAGTYSHKDLRECIKNLNEEMNRVEGHNNENDSRFCTIEKKLSEFIEGRRAAVEATKEKILETQGEDNGL